MVNSRIYTNESNDNCVLDINTILDWILVLSIKKQFPQKITLVKEILYYQPNFKTYKTR